MNVLIEPQDEAAPRIPVWISMTEEERRVTLHAMVRFGGGFVSRLGEAWQRADTVNSIRLGAAMADYVRQYGPGSDAFRDAYERELGHPYYSSMNREMTA